MSQSTIRIVCEQAVYGSFPFWDKGYAILAQSGGCRSEWLSDLIHLCQSLGQPPSEAAPAVASFVFAHKLPSGPWVVGQASAQGCDDRGRPGAWAFHALFLSARDYRQCGGTPFVFLPLLRTTFDREIQLDTLSATIAPALPTHESIDMQKQKWLVRGRKIRILAEQSIDVPLSRFWHGLPASKRARLSITSWAFRTDCDFDVAALPPARWPQHRPFRESAVWAVNPAELFRQNPPEISTGTQYRIGTATVRKFGRIAVSGIVFVLVCLGLRSCLWSNPRQSARPLAEQAVQDDLPPDAHRFVVEKTPTAVEQTINELLTDWSERLDIPTGDASQFSPVDAAQRISNAVRYTGPSFTHNRIKTGVKGPSQSRALAYSTQIDRLIRVKDYPEVPKEAQLNGRYALACMAWSIGANDMQDEASRLHSRDDVRRWFEQMSERLIPQSIADDLAPTGYEQQFPELVEYRLHLSRLARLRE